MLGLCASPPLAHAQSDSTVYDDALQSGWENWSWATINFNDTGRVHNGAKAIRVDADKDQALYLHHAAIDTTDSQSLSFWINGGAGASTNPQRLQVQATLGGVPQAAVKLPALSAETWKKVMISLSDLGVAGKTNFDGFWIQDATGSRLPSFWVDDITIDGTPAPGVVRIDVDAANTIRTIDGRIYGLNTAVWDQYLGSPSTSSLLGAMGTNVLRFPGGSMSNDYHWNTGRSNSGTYWVSNFATFAKIAGGTSYISVNYGSGTPEEAAAWVAYANASPGSGTTIGVDSKGRDWKTAGYWAAIRAASPLPIDDGMNFLRVGRAAPYGFTYWEIGNENYGSWEVDQHGDAGSGLSGQKYDATTYANEFARFWAKMRAVDSSVRLGAVVAKEYGGWTSTVFSRLKALGVTPNFAVYHHYPQEPGSENDATLLQAGSKIGGEAATLRGQINGALGAELGNTVELAITELNSVTFNPGKQTTSLVNGLFYADALASLARTEFNACTWWDLRNGTTYNNNSSSLYGWRQYGDYGMVAAGDGPAAANTPYPTFYGAKLLRTWGRGGDQVVNAGSNSALLSAHAAKLAGGGMALLVVNKSSSKDLLAEINLANFNVTSSGAQIYQYGKPNDTANGDLSNIAFGGVAPKFTYTFPSYSMTVIIIAGSSSGGGTTPTPTPTPNPTPSPTPTNIPTPTPTSIVTPTPTPVVTPTPVPSSGWEVSYKVTNQWTGGFNADVTIKNNGPVINGWTLGWKFNGNQQIANAWSGVATQTGQNVSVTNAAWNATIPTGSSVTFGFQATWSGTNPNPTNFTLNGSSSTSPTPTPTPVVTPTPTPTPTVVPTPTPTPKPTVTPTPTPTVTPTPVPGSSCVVTYKVPTQWTGAFNGDVTIKNNGPAINGWTLAWKFDGNQKVVNAWNGDARKTGKT